MNHRIRLHFPQQHQAFVSPPFHPDDTHSKAMALAEVTWQASAHGLTKRNDPVMTEEYEDGTPIVGKHEKPKPVQDTLPL